jgi:hypothetical protein
MRKGLLISLLFVLAANAATLAFIALNRQKDEATLVLTERELRLSSADLENTGLALTLAWEYPRDVWQANWARFRWFDSAKLESVGYDCSIPPGDPKARDHYRRQAFAPRSAYIVLEYQPEVPDVAGVGASTNPSTWPPLTEADRTRLPRLHVIDAGQDAGELLARYSDRNRFVVAAGSVQMVYRRPGETQPEPTPTPGTEGREPAIYGRVIAVYPFDIYVPKEHRAVLDELRREGGPTNRWSRLQHDPRYEVTVVWGSRLEPRVVGVRRR